MLWLPHTENDRCRWPLSDFSAAGLLSAKAARNEPAVAAVRAALEHDAAFSLWAVCRARADGHNHLPTCDALADWLATNSARVLAWPDDVEQAPGEPAWLARHRRLSAISVAVARRARQQAGASSEFGRQAYLLGLLHLADEWRELGGAPAAGRQAPIFPDWLVAALAELADAAARSATEAVRLVASARRECDEMAALEEYDRLTATGPLTGAALAAAAQCLPLVAGSRAFDERFTAAKLAALAEFAAGAGHEINNPIAVICGRAQLLLEAETSPQRRHELAVINTQAMRVFEMISDMMLFARPPEPKLAACDVAVVARQVVLELQSKAADRQVALRFEGGGGSFVANADATQIAVVVRALCENAMAAAPRGGYVVVGVERGRVDGESGEVLLSVSDNGPGIAPAVREHLFDPFFSGRQAGRGLGMGLAKVGRIVTGHGGGIEVRTGAADGSTLTVSLPAARNIH
ncbi:MAG TPA: HAMP domain-containing sensor histidine kinase [Pirellulales bacterium]